MTPSEYCKKHGYDEKAFKRGMRAHSKGVAFEDNFYVFASKRRSWQAGWAVGERLLKLTSKFKEEEQP